MLPRLFEPFSPKMAHIASNQEGTGLGLSITKGLIEAHGGEISVATRTEDQPESDLYPEHKTGTVMRLSFPTCANI
jgi:signal transduction histidine kinase